MALENRGGRLYYYRKRREGRRVVSEYVTGGSAGVMLAKLAAADRAEADARKAQERSAREADEALDGLLDAIGAALKEAASVRLLAAGCHNHKGEWRVIRGGQS
jgi:hypothetical protein